MKDGAGNLDFGDNNEDDEETAESVPPGGTSRSADQRDRSQSRSSEQASSPSTDEAEQNGHKYPYFVRRSKVLDERDERIEVHLRKEITDQEPDFRSDLADELGTNEDISKSDAREFALLFAFENPEGVAELMREEGFGELD